MLVAGHALWDRSTLNSLELLLWENNVSLVELGEGLLKRDVLVIFHPLLALC